MRSSELVAGRMRQYDSPDWKSLERLLGLDELCAHFMWMHDVVLDDGTVLNAYKHRWTRCYFHLAEDARTYCYVTDDLYREVEPYAAIKAVFARWESLAVKPTTEERRAVRAALRRARAQTKPE